jgi:hypothetical protein
MIKFREYGFSPDWCHAADPQSKRIVENLCGYAQRDLAVPLLTEAAMIGASVDLRTANAAAKVWCAEVNSLVHSEIRAVPDERLTVERELLAPLPSLRLEIGAPSVTRKVDRLSCVRYGSARYSVPTRLIGATVDIVIDCGALLVLEPATGAIVAEHELLAPGAASILDSHYDVPARAQPRAATETTAEHQFCALGQDAEPSSSVPSRCATTSGLLWHEDSWQVCPAVTCIESACGGGWFDKLDRTIAAFDSWTSASLATRPDTGSWPRNSSTIVTAPYGLPYATRG